MHRYGHQRSYVWVISTLEVSHLDHQYANFICITLFSNGDISIRGADLPTHVAAHKSYPSGVPQTNMGMFTVMRDWKWNAFSNLSDILALYKKVLHNKLNLLQQTDEKWNNITYTKQDESLQSCVYNCVETNLASWMSKIKIKTEKRRNKQQTKNKTLKRKRFMCVLALQLRGHFEHITGIFESGSQDSYQEQLHSACMHR